MRINNLRVHCESKIAGDCSWCGCPSDHLLFWFIKNSKKKRAFEADFFRLIFLMREEKCALEGS
jgi:hypothetical protein